VRYDDAGPLAGLDSDQQQAAIWAAPDGIKYDVQFNVDKDMKAPVRGSLNLGAFICKWHWGSTYIL